jgi:hypothetical protein
MEKTIQQYLHVKRLIDTVKQRPSLGRIYQPPKWETKKDEDDAPSSEDEKVGTEGELVIQIGRLWRSYSSRFPIAWSTVVSVPREGYQPWFKLNLEPKVSILLLAHILPSELRNIMIEYARPHFITAPLPPPPQTNSYVYDYYSISKPKSKPPNWEDKSYRDPNAGRMAVVFPQDAELIAKDLCVPSPYGDLKTTTTQYDDNVRKALEYSHGEAVLLSYDCQSFMKGLATAVSHTLFGGDPIRFTLNKLNVYGEGGHFTKHIDTPRPNVRGTLLIEFPYEYKEGQFVWYDPDNSSSAISIFEPMSLYRYNNKDDDKKRKKKRSFCPKPLLWISRYVPS